MAEYRNRSGEAIGIPLIGDRIIEPGETFEVEDDVAAAHSFSPELFETVVAPKGPPAPTEPAKNASTQAWREWAVAQGADPDSVADRGRDDLIAEYGTKED